MCRRNCCMIVRQAASPQSSPKRCSPHNNDTSMFRNRYGIPSLCTHDTDQQCDDSGHSANIFNVATRTMIYLLHTTSYMYLYNPKLICRLYKRIINIHGYIIHKIIPITDYHSIQEVMVSRKSYILLIFLDTKFMTSCKQLWNDKCVAYLKIISHIL